MNAFDAYAEAVKPSWAASRERAHAKAAETRAKSKAQKALEEEEALTRLWLRGEKQRRRELLDGPHGEDVKGLIAFLKTMTLESAPDLVAFIERAAWMQDLPNAVKVQLLGIIGQAIGKLHRDEGFDYPNDALWGEEPRAHAVIKNLMGAR